MNAKKVTTKWKAYLFMKKSVNYAQQSFFDRFLSKLFGNSLEFTCVGLLIALTFGFNVELTVVVPACIESILDSFVANLTVSRNKIPIISSTMIVKKPNNHLRWNGLSRCIDCCCSVSITLILMDWTSAGKLQWIFIVSTYSRKQNCQFRFFTSLWLNASYFDREKRISLNIFTRNPHTNIHFVCVHWNLLSY